jgi:hypothetical protein
MVNQCCDLLKGLKSDYSTLFELYNTLRPRNYKKVFF